MAVTPPVNTPPTAQQPPLLAAATPDPDHLQIHTALEALAVRINRTQSNLGTATKQITALDDAQGSLHALILAKTSSTPNPDNTAAIASLNQTGATLVNAVHQLHGDIISIRAELSTLEHWNDVHQRNAFSHITPPSDCPSPAEHIAGIVLRLELLEALPPNPLAHNFVLLSQRVGTVELTKADLSALENHVADPESHTETDLGLENAYADRQALAARILAIETQIHTDPELIRLLNDPTSRGKLAEHLAEHAHAHRTLAARILALESDVD
jgi:hypothetical protein